MQRVLLVGAGKIGGTIASFLSRSGDYDVLVADADEASLRRVAESAQVETVKLNADDPAALHKAASGRGVIVRKSVRKSTGEIDPDSSELWLAPIDAVNHSRVGAFSCPSLAPDPVPRAR